MTLTLHHQNLLELDTPALLLAIDGAARGMEGNLARAFARRWPERWQEIEETLRFPVPLGRVFEVELSENGDSCPFQVVVLASTLFHQQVLTPAARQGLIRSAVEDAFRVLRAYRIDSLASAVMRGGWRLELEPAFIAMLKGLQGAQQVSLQELNLCVCSLDGVECDRLRDLARLYGWPC